jgi:hypothetical protein
MKVMMGMRFTCGDVMYSGHSVNMTLMNLVWQEYMPAHWRGKALLRVVCWLANIGGLLTCVATHFHYSADCLLGFSISCCFFHLYHLGLKVPRPAVGEEADSTSCCCLTRFFFWFESDHCDETMQLGQSSRCARARSSGIGKVFGSELQKRHSPHTLLRCADETEEETDVDEEDGVQLALLGRRDFGTVQV